MLIIIFISLSILLGGYFVFTPQQPKSLDTPLPKGKEWVLCFSIKNIIRWEQLNAKSFYEFDYLSEEDLLSFFYVCSQTEASLLPLNEFKESLTESSLTKMIQLFEEESAYMVQFQDRTINSGEKNNKESKEEVSTYIKDIIPTLIFNGLDAYFALNELTLTDLPLYINAYDRDIKSKMESSRLWTFLSMTPHIKLKKPQDILKFPWETVELTEGEKTESLNILKSMIKDKNKNK